MPESLSVYRWSSIDRVTNAALTFTGNLVLARLLTPADFGLLAMVAIFAAIAGNVSMCGMADGLIHKPRPTLEDYSTVMVFNAVCGLAFGGAFVALAGPIAGFFGHPQLRPIMWSIGVCFFFRTLSTVQETRMRKELKMRQMCLARTLATASAVGLGIVLAANGGGYWGLVSCQVFLEFFTFVSYMAVGRWWPGVRFSRRAFRELFGYGFNLMLAYSISMVSRYVNTFVLGRVSARASGLFFQGAKMQEVPYAFTEAVFNWPFFAVLSNEQDRGRRRVLTADMLGWLSMLNVTMGMGMMLVSAPAFLVLFGAKWDGAIPVFRILIIYGIATALKSFFQTVLKANGLTRRMRNYSVVEIIIQLGLLALAFPFGLQAVAWSQVLAAVVLLAVYARAYARVEGLTFSQVVQIAIVPLDVPALAFVATGVCYWMWNDHAPAVASLVATAGMFMVLCVVMWEARPRPTYLRYRNALLRALRLTRTTPAPPSSSEP